MSWQEQPVGNVFRVVNGGTPKTTVARFWGGKHQWITPAEMGGLDSPHLSTSRRTLTDEGLSAGAELVPANSIILSSRAPIGHLVINDVPMAFNQGCKGLVPSPGIDTKFAYYFFLANVPLLESLGTGATFKELSGGKLKEIAFRFPGISRQRRIVAILDEAFAGITTAKANAEKCVENGCELFARELDDLIHDPKWEWKTIGDLCDRVEYGTSAKSKPQGKVAVLRMGNIQGGKLNWENLVYSDDKDEISKYLLHPGDVLFNRTNSPELVGKTAIYNGEQPAIFAGYLIRIHRKQNALSAEFLNYFLNSRFALDHGKTVMTSSVHQANISGSKLLAYRIPAPSLRQQRHIVEKLDALRAETRYLETLYTRKLAALDELKQSLLHQAFSGQL